MYEKIFLGTFNYFLPLQRASSKRCILICGTHFCLPVTNLFKIAPLFNSWHLTLNNKPLKSKFFYICMAFIRDFIKSSKKRLFWGWIHPCTKKIWWFFQLFRGLFTSCLYKVSKKFWFTEIGLVDFKKNFSQIWKTQFREKRV